MRQMISLSDSEWLGLETYANKRGRTSCEALVEFWRIALGYSPSEWGELGPAAIKVTEFELPNHEHERLYRLIVKRRRARHHRLEAGLAWLHLGPAEPMLQAA
jgi:hypothetical protein